MESAATTRSNVDVLREMDEAMARGDFATFFGSYAPDVVVHVAGNNALAGTYRGLDQLQALFGRFMQASGQYTFENHAYLADDQRGVILQRGTMRRDGETFVTDEAFVYTLRDGKIAEFWYLPFDQAGVDAWWAKA
jgi:ketosteroid isomerase-like protein